MFHFLALALSLSLPHAPHTSTQSLLLVVGISEKGFLHFARSSLSLMKWMRVLINNGAFLSLLQFRERTWTVRTM